MREGSIGATDGDVTRPSAADSPTAGGGGGGSGSSGGRVGSIAGSANPICATGAPVISPLLTSASQKAQEERLKIPSWHDSWQEQEEEKKRAAWEAEHAPADALMLDASAAAPGRIYDCGGRQYRRYLRLASQLGSSSAAHRRRRSASVCCLPVLSPVGRFAQAWAGLSMLVDLTYTAFFVSLSLAFNAAGSRLWMDIIDLIGNLFYIADVVLGFHIGFLARWDGRVVAVQDGRAVARQYVLHGTFFLDLLASLPAVVQLVVSATGDSHDALRLLWLLRLLRLARVAHLLNSLRGIDTAGSSLRFLGPRLSARKLMLLVLLFSLVVLLNLMGCIWWLLAISQGIPNSWASPDVLRMYVDLETASDATCWVWSVYYALTTITTIGYGDIVPVTTVEALGSLVFMLTGVAYFGYFLSTVGALLEDPSADGRRRVALQERLEEVERWMGSLALPSALERDIRRYYTCSWVPAQERDTDRLYQDLPRALQLRIAMQQQHEALKELGLAPVTPLRPASSKHVRQLVARASAPRLLLGGELLWRAGEAARFFCILDEGEVLLEAPDGSRELAAAPCILGISALFAGSVPECAVRQHAVRGVSGASHMWVVDARAVGRQLEAGYPLVLQHVARGVLLRLNALWRRLGPREGSAVPAGAAAGGPAAAAAATASAAAGPAVAETAQAQVDLTAAAAAGAGARTAAAAAAADVAAAAAGAGARAEEGLTAQQAEWAGILPLPPRRSLLQLDGESGVAGRAQQAAQRAQREALLNALQAMAAGVQALVAKLEPAAAAQAQSEAAEAEEQGQQQQKGRKGRPRHTPGPPLAGIVCCCGAGGGGGGGGGGAGLQASAGEGLASSAQLAAAVGEKRQQQQQGGQQQGWHGWLPQRRPERPPSRNPAATARSARRRAGGGSGSGRTLSSGGDSDTSSGGGSSSADGAADSDASGADARGGRRQAAAVPAAMGVL